MYLKRVSCSFLLSGLIMFGTFFMPVKDLSAQTKVRVGVFDSRAIAVAFYNSKYSTAQQTFASLGTRMKEAREKDDKKAIADLEREGSMRQAVMHDQGFGKGTINMISETIKDKIAQIAKSENLAAVLSKWELVFNSEDVVIVDITLKIADLFEPNEKMKNMLNEIIKSEPVKEAYLVRD